MPRWDLNLTLDCIPKYKVNVLPVVPSIIHSLLSSPRIKEIDTSSVQIIPFGAAHLSKHMELNLQAAFPNAVISEGYALSETTLGTLIRVPALATNDRTEDQPTGISQYSSYHRPKLLISVLGILHVGVEGLILRPDGTHCLPGEPGYWRDPKATAETFLPGGWLRTGDIFSADTRGFFYFKERSKDTLKISGLQVAPTEIEDAIFAEPSGLVEDVAVAGVLLPNSRLSDEKSPRAWIVLSPKGRRLGGEHVQKVIDNWIRERLSKYKWLRGGIQFVDQIPKSPTGKVLRRTLQDEYVAQHSTSSTKL
ncbi:hypothetical protein Clacol_010234 [Clathrus columnatus]|uniref:Uncharacterized protein n=1 Tax=Clathrus columnatus TaxID=1419009 RepID=A0AAV5AVQ0_9AGAM|nr:hypothetical protein Clacol_010234 [Clathrus columnatus]